MQMEIDIVDNQLEVFGKSSYTLMPARVEPFDMAPASEAQPIE